MAEFLARKFGVEIECGNDDHNPETVRKLFKEREIPITGVDYDGSGIELKTAPMPANNKGFEYLKTVFAVLNEIKCYVTEDDGQHVHFEALDYAQDKSLCARMIRSYLTNRDTIIQFIDPYRRANYEMCANAWAGEYSPHSEAHPNAIELLEKGRLLGSKGYDVNLANLRANGRGTIEVRLLEGNLDFEKARAWISFWVGFLDTCKRAKRPLGKFGSDDTLMNRIGVDSEMRQKLKEAAEKYGNA